MVDLVREEDDAGLRASQAECEKLIAHEMSRGIPKTRIVLAGFSQGGAITLQAGLRHTERLAGLMVLSSYLPIASTVANEATPANKDIPIYMAHGTRDPIIALDRAVASKDTLEALGYKVEWHQYPMEHSMALEEIRDVREWLGTLLAP